MDFIAGEILYFNKPLKWTSFDLVNKFRYKLSRKLHVKKIKVGPNDPCPCGSGKKYKKCCRDKDLAAQVKRLNALMSFNTKPRNTSPL